MINKQVFLQKFVESALLQVKEGNLDEYHKLVKVFAYTRHSTLDATATKYTTEVSPWIQALSANVSSLGITYRDLVTTVFSSDWVTAPNPRFVRSYTTLILQIVSAHPEWVPQAMSSLARWFTYGGHHKDTEPERVHSHVHVLIQEIHRAIPTCGPSLVAALAESWPFRAIRANVQVVYVRNVLRCLEYAGGVRREVLQMVLNHVLQIDVEVQVELDDLESDEESEVEDTGVFEFEDEEQSDAKDGDQSDAKDDESEESGSDSDSDSDSESDADSVTSDLGRARYNAKKTVAKLDALMSTLLTWLERHCHVDEQTGEMSESTSRLFLLFLDLFDTVILPTFKSRYTQFVLFYFSSQNAEYSDVFLGTMVGNLGEPMRSAHDRVSSVTKVSAAAYLGSFVARAKFLTPSVVRSVVGVLVQWANTYMDWYEEQDVQSVVRTYAQALGAPQAEIERHVVFFAVSQAILYMFCFRWRDLAESQSGGPIVETELDSVCWCTELEGLQRIVFSRLNPLHACAPAVAQQFASVASQTNFMFCYAVLQQNRRTNGYAGDATASPDLALRNKLDSFFPFDPMALPVSRQFIDGIYMEWQDVGDEPDELDQREGRDIPEDEAGVMEQIVSMSISPVPPLSALPGQTF
ncbi:DNA independent RNA polymerase I transcription factor [Coemansia sp. RSA 1807]|nr:DNA independent RNA polymerase I transcription factor [Coemansia sp. RSA 788]KAJ2147057.1 DNA independent RNA polymerase I transcription factor [Coemansia sp. RSA 564]KAJ2168189.1 DNA independent RNA polymerase I transcription factor [Coemansia sp. RSA 562]KAJ2176077.1 DNA independent RNA polymerase I transcription factor [Coemansia sp. RSA 560]KAJ2199242.1 DNA independent RNA polymerase I transcription factor [Coemansia sp. RSA 530]KAJ2224951.1 DNA independent RNA polymerase I transcriptio